MDCAIGEMVRQRPPGAFGGADDGQRAWGLALSGGGIRSATFCLGLMKSLAADRQLLRFDLVSTVSGGGYIGATLGRLCAAAKSADEVRAVERAFAEVDRARFGWWLRANGRYLIPGGMRDTLFAAALYLRNLLGTHIELAIAACLVGMALAASNLLMWDAVFRAVDLNNAHTDDGAGGHRPAGEGGDAVAHPVVRGGGAVHCVDRAGLCVLVGARQTFAQVPCWCRWACGCARDRRVWSGRGSCPRRCALAVGRLRGLCACWIVALLWVLYRSRRRTAGRAAQRADRRPGGVLNTTLLIGLLGLLDRAAWWLAAEKPGAARVVRRGAAGGGCGSCAPCCRWCCRRSARHPVSASRCCWRWPACSGWCWPSASRPGGSAWCTRQCCCRCSHRWGWTSRAAGSGSAPSR